VSRAPALKLRDVSNPKGDANRYCGPAAISVLTGMGTGEAARLLRSVSGRAAIKGTSNTALWSALRRCGIDIEERWTPPAGTSPTLAAWLRSTSGERGGKVFLIVAGNHYQLVSGNRFVCGKTREVVGLDHPKVSRRARVEIVWTVKATPKGIAIPLVARKPSTAAHKKAESAETRAKVARLQAEIAGLERQIETKRDAIKALRAAARQPKPKTAAQRAASHRSKAQRLAAKWGIEIERESMPGGPIHWVWGPKAVYRDEHGDPLDDPCEGSHSCHGWDEVLETVEIYVRDLQEKGNKPSL
jgi:hypothetical protein